MLGNFHLLDIELEDLGDDCALNGVRRCVSVPFPQSLANIEQFHQSNSFQKNRSAKGGFLIYYCHSLGAGASRELVRETVTNVPFAATTPLPSRRRCASSPIRFRCF